MIMRKYYPRHTFYDKIETKCWTTFNSYVLFKGVKAVGEMSLPTVSSPLCRAVTPRPPSRGPSPPNRIKEKPFLVRQPPHLSNLQPGRGSQNLVLLARQPAPRKMLKSKIEVSVIVVNTLKESHILITCSPIKHGQNIHSRS